MESQSRLENRLRELAIPAASIRLVNDEPQDATVSFAGGMPYFEAGETWPTCSACGQSMTFALQVAASEHAVPLPPAWALVVLFACQNHCIGRHEAGQAGSGGAATIAVHTYGNPSVNKATVPSQHNANEPRRKIEFEPRTSLPDFTAVESWDPVGVTSLFGTDFDLYDELSRKVCGDLKFSFVGGWPEWDNLSDMTPVVDGERLRHILQIDDGIGDVHFYEQASLFGNESGVYRLVYDGT